MKPKALYILGEFGFNRIYGEAEQADIAALCDVIAPPQTPESIKEHPELLSDVEIIFSGWGAPVFDADFLGKAQKLKAVFYGAGSVRGCVTPEFWKRGIVLTSSWVANAVPVSEFALAEILLSLKLAWRHISNIKLKKEYARYEPECPGAYKSTVALLSLGMIGRKVARLLSNFELKVLAYDPFAKPEDAAELGVELVSLEDAFKRADVVSMHTPWLKETENMITGDLLRSMKPNATFINTSRGAIVDEKAMCQVLQERPDLTAVLDVTWPEPPAKDSPLLTLENVVLTPHIAGSLANECHRMAQYAIDECRRFLNGEKLQYQITEEMAARMA
ncbi:MAG: hydroxyacid dehydrogenase [Victivallales bacterium]|nr:hydroxyacid dehydrogenase [Victivallales bacterium]